MATFHLDGVVVRHVWVVRRGPRRRCLCAGRLLQLDVVERCRVVGGSFLLSSKRGGAVLLCMLDRVRPTNMGVEEKQRQCQQASEQFGRSNAAEAFCDGYHPAEGLCAGYFILSNKN